MKVTYIDHMGSDLTVVNAARVSFDKESDWETKCTHTHDRCDQTTYGCDWCDKKLEERDQKLINYLARHNHWTPFGHPQVQLHVKAPLFVARQLGKHQVGMVWNEVSRRYVGSEPELYWPKKWRKKATNKKQGSSQEEYKLFGMYWGHIEDSVDIYLDMVEGGCAPEMARMILPQNTYTEWYWTGSLAAWFRVYNLRIKEDTQEETREIAKQIGEIIQPLFPCSWEALCSVRNIT